MGLQECSFLLDEENTLDCDRGVGVNNERWVSEMRYQKR